MTLIDNMSPMRQQEITQFYGTELDIFGDVLIRDEGTDTGHESTDRVTSPAPSNATFSPCSDPQQEALNLLVDELKQQYIDAGDFKQLALQTDYFDHQLLSEHLNVIAQQFEKSLKPHDQLVVNQNTDGDIRFSVVRGSVVQRKRRDRSL